MNVIGMITYNNITIQKYNVILMKSLNNQVVINLTSNLHEKCILNLFN